MRAELAGEQVERSGDGQRRGGAAEAGGGHGGGLALLRLRVGEGQRDSGGHVLDRADAAEADDPLVVDQGLAVARAERRALHVADRPRVDDAQLDQEQVGLPRGDGGLVEVDQPGAAALVDDDVAGMRVAVEGHAGSGRAGALQPPLGAGEGVEAGAVRAPQRGEAGAGLRLRVDPLVGLGEEVGERTADTADAPPHGRRECRRLGVVHGAQDRAKPLPVEGVLAGVDRVLAEDPRRDRDPQPAVLRPGVPVGGAVRRRDARHPRLAQRRREREAEAPVAGRRLDAPQRPGAVGRAPDARSVVESADDGLQVDEADAELAAHQIARPGARLLDRVHPAHAAVRAPREQVLARSVIGGMGAG
ncbi:hypothetical protein C5C44_16505 [Rathayibacter sp. AY1F6]|nr:hypothetical protein C5C44_16505 [Rathayibacter sp. AY1F6]